MISVVQLNFALTASSCNQLPTPSASKFLIHTPPNQTYFYLWQYSDDRSYWSIQVPPPPTMLIYDSKRVYCLVTVLYNLPRRW